ncbi:unnamed protein product [Rotaria socialis]|uniref:Uncharacterized protein n=2 Tax=Rotaria socialis TaxID=392032 RepID=A0A820N9I4_9BILA|nr:unnamed protein product [Rotaria socialis]CAF3372926.1 unnamed protein product [Rotaria socialis]CAF3387655.1 unnamed protein product [Rotaria socialis]CAF3446269.1 unnamed protein product [Rotaria socialis]CAF3471236.1 unnamed protein product [Rotaria socialis]
MSDQPPPEKPKAKNFSHLQSEPVPISFLPQQFLNQLSAGNGSVFPMSAMKTPNYAPMQMGNLGNDKSIASQQTQHAASSSTSTALALVKPASSGPHYLKPMLSQPIDTSIFKGFKFVTLDGMLVETRDVYDKISGTYQWEMCENQDERCINLIRDNFANKRVFLITSGGLGQKIVPKIHELAQVYAIYIYCVNVKFHSEWAKEYTKVRVVSDNDDSDLIPQFAVDVAQANIDWGNGFLKQGNREKAKEKFKLASDKLNNYARNHDPAMDVEIKNKLEECK